MKSIKTIKLSIAAFILSLTTTSLVSANDKIKRPIGSIKPPVVHPKPVLKKTYKVPGSTAIGTAKRYGYSFAVGMKDAPKGCRFIGSHWHIPANSNCEIIGFKSNKKKCRFLRKGWTIEDIKFNNININDQATNSYYLPRGNDPLIQLWPRNRTTKAKAVTIKHIVLKGPSGSFNKFKEAFSHCSE